MTLVPSANEVRTFREETGCGMEEARRVLLKKNILLEIESLGPREAKIAEILRTLIRELL